MDHEQKQPADAVGSSEGLGPASGGARKCPACHGSGVIEEHDGIGLVYQGPCDLCTEPEED